MLRSMLAEIARTQIVYQLISAMLKRFALVMERTVAEWQLTCQYPPKPSHPGLTQ